MVIIRICTKENVEEKEIINNVACVGFIYVLQLLCKFSLLVFKYETQYTRQSLGTEYHCTFGIPS